MSAAYSSTDILRLDMSRLWPLAKTLFRSRGDAVALLTVAAVSVWGILQLSGRLQLAAVWLSAELIFFAYQRWRYLVLSGGIPDDACMDRERAAVIMQRLYELERLEGWTLQQFFSGWFMGAPPETIRRGNLLDFTAYGFFAAKFEDLPAEMQAVVETYITKCQEKFGYTFAEGRNDALQFMGHLWEPLRVLHKPFAMVLTSEAVSLITDATLFCLGFKVKRCQGFRYWVRKARGKKAPAPMPPPLGEQQPEALPKLRSMTSDLGLEGRATPHAAATPGHARQRHPVPGAHSPMNVWDSVSSLEDLPEALTGSAGEPVASSAPIFFMHGVGLGLTPYIHFIYQLMTTFFTRDVVLLECRHVSLSLCSRAVSPDVVCEAIVEVMRRNHWPRAAFVGHSYGTFVLSRVAQLHRPIVESMVLLDPVCMFTVWPQLLQNFVYKLPQLSGGILGLIDGARYLFSRDLVIAEAFCRKFVWHKVMLWPEEMADCTLLVLSAFDDLVPAHLVERQLKQMNSPCQVLVNPNCGHGGFLIDAAFGRQVLDNIKQVLNAGAALAAKAL